MRCFFALPSLVIVKSGGFNSFLELAQQLPVGLKASSLTF